MPTLSQHAGDLIRIVNAVLAIMVGGGLGFTLVLRWERLTWSERIIRIGIIEMMVATIYGARIALAEHIRFNEAAMIYTLGLATTVVGLGFWLFLDVLPNLPAKDAPRDDRH